ncbi:hypothetical protein HAALTHF_07370n [Vreelandella aquamarina]|nr:hypothetical protein HAALTHF_07370n [Halomonas axialensis]
MPYFGQLATRQPDNSMADNDSDQEKTEEATPRRLDKAREEGQVPRSRELTTLHDAAGWGDGVVGYGANAL